MCSVALRHVRGVHRGAPHLFAGAVAAGLGAAGLGLHVDRDTMTVAVAVAGAGAVLLAGPAASLATCAALLAGAGILGLARMDATAPRRVALPAHVDTAVVVDGPVARRRTGGWRVIGTVRVTDDGLAAGTRVILRLDGEPPEVGEIVRVRAVLRDPAGHDAPDWWRRYLERHRVAAAASLRRPPVIGVRGGIAGTRDAAGRAVRRRVAAVLGGDVAAIVGGVTVGADERLTDRMREAFRAAGLSHLLAVSGQNVALVAVCVVVFLGLAGLGRTPALAAAAVAVVGYAAVCQPGASVGRAAVTALAVIGAEVASRPHMRWHALLVALVVLLAWQPRAITDPGLLLSFAAVAGLLGLAPVLTAALRGRVPDALAAALAVSAAASLATAPVLVGLFGELSLVGLAINIVAVPLAGVVLVTGLTGALLGLVAAPLGTPLLLAAGGGAALLMHLAEAGAAAPGAAVTLPAWTAPIAALPALVVGGAARSAARAVPSGAASERAAGPGRARG